jgi:hypothetical protein
MSEAPKEIYIQKWTGEQTANLDTRKHYEEDVRYIRADLVEITIEQLGQISPYLLQKIIGDN